VDSQLFQIVKQLNCSKETLNAAQELDSFLEKGMPYPISHPLWRICFDDEGKRRDPANFDSLWVNWLLQSFENFLRLTSLSLVMDYLLSHDTVELQEDQIRLLNDSLGKLRSPSFGIWIDWMSRIKNVLTPKGNIEPLLDQFFRTYTDKKLSIPNRLYSFVKLRNDLATTHGNRGNSPEHIPGILREGFDKLLPLLKDANWFNGIVLYMLERPLTMLEDVESWRLDIPYFSSKDLVSNELALGFDLKIHPEINWEFGPFEFIMVNEKKQRFQPLSPLTIHKQGLDYSLELLKRDRVQIYAGDTGRKIIYTGMGYIEDKLISNLNIKNLGHLFLLRSITIDDIPAIACNVETIKDRTVHACKLFLAEEVKRSDFDNSVFISRNDLKNHFETFFECKEPAMLVTGSTGIGKSWEICKQVSNYITVVDDEICEKNDLIMILPVPVVNISRGVNKPADLMQEIMQHIHIAGKWCDFKKKLYEFGQPEEFQGEGWNTKLVIILEGVNEYESGTGGKRLYDIIQRLISEIWEYKVINLKILYTVRIEYLPTYIKDFKGKSILPDVKFHYHDFENAAKNKDGHIEAWIEMCKWNTQEIRLAYEHYKHNNGPLTSPDDLVNNTRLCQLLGHPYMMRLACEGYCNTYLPNNLVLPDIYNKYLENKIPKESVERWGFTKKILRIMLLLGTESPTLDDFSIKDIDNEPGSPLVYLLNEGVLVRIDIIDKNFDLKLPALKFSHDGLAEYLLSELWLEENYRSNASFYEISYWQNLLLQAEKLSLVYGGCINLMIRLQKANPHKVGKLILELATHFGADIHEKFLYPAIQSILEIDGQDNSTVQKLWKTNFDEIYSKNLGDFFIVVANNLSDYKWQKTAQRAYECALKIRKKLCVDQPESVKLRHDYAIICRKWAGLIMDLGEFEEAGKFYRQALNIFKLLNEEQPDNVDIIGDFAATCCMLAILLQDYDQLKETKKLYRQAFNILEIAYNKNYENVELDHDFAITCNFLALFLNKHGQADEVEKLHRKALRINEQLYNKYPDRVDIAESYGASCNNLALFLKEYGKVIEAEKLYRNSLDIRKLLYRENSARIDIIQSYSTTCNNIALFLNDRGKVIEAEKLYRNSFDLEIKLHIEYPDRVDMVQSLIVTSCNLAGFLKRNGEVIESEKLYRLSLEIIEGLYNSHPENVGIALDVSFICNNMAVFLTNYGFAEEVEKLYQRALEIRETLYKDHPERVDIAIELNTSYNNIALYYYNNCKVKEAEKLFRQTLTSIELLHKAHPEIVDITSGLGLACDNLAGSLDDKLYAEEKEKLYRRALQIRKKLNKDYPERVEFTQDLNTTSNNLALCLSQIYGEPNEPKGLFLNVLKIDKQLHEKYPERIDIACSLGNAFINFAGFLEDINQVKEVGKLYRQALDLLSQLYDKHPKNKTAALDYAVTCNHLAKFINRYGSQKEEVKKLYRQAIRIKKLLYEENHGQLNIAQSLAATCRNLAGFYKDNSQVEDAVKFYKQTLNIEEKLFNEHPDRLDLKENLIKTRNKLNDFLSS